MRLLFLDNDQARRSTMRASLERLHPRWLIANARDTANIERLLDATAWDAIILADSRHQQNIEAFKKARTFKPEALRIALVDSAADASLLGQADVAHRVIVQPVDMERLGASLKSMKALERMLDSDELKQRIAKIGQLPRAPDLALSLLREGNDGTANIARVAERLHGDAGLSAKVLQLSNSTYYSRGQPVLDIERALTRLGLNAVINLVMAAQSFSDPELQHRAILASHIATRVLRDVDRPELCQTAATAATLAFIGKLLNLSDGRKMICTPDDDIELFSRQLPVECLGGAYLLSRWGLPWPIIEAVAYHEQPMASSELGFGVTTGVHIGCALADGRPLDEEWLEFLDAGAFIDTWKGCVDELEAAAKAA